MNLRTSAGLQYRLAELLSLEQLTEPPQVGSIPADRFPAFPIGHVAEKIVIDEMVKARDFCLHYRVPFSQVRCSTGAAFWGISLKRGKISFENGVW